MWLNKQAGTLTIEEIVRLIIVTAGIFLIIILIGALIYPFIFGDDEVLDSYFKTFVKELENTDDGEVGEFEIWQADQDGGVYLVYFNEEVVYSPTEYENLRFFVDTSSLKDGQVYENYICMCRPSNEETKYCNKKFCKSLKQEVLFKGDNGQLLFYPQWILGFNQKIIMGKQGDSYLFELVNKTEEK